MGELGSRAERTDDESGGVRECAGACGGASAGVGGRRMGESNKSSARTANPLTSQGLQDRLQHLAPGTI